MFPRMSVVAALAASFVLSGCFFSETPKFPAETAVAAFGDGGRFQGYDRTEDDRYKKADEAIIIVKRRGDGGTRRRLRGKIESAPNGHDAHRADGYQRQDQVPSHVDPWSRALDSAD